MSNIFDRLRELAAFNEGEHPRGQPKNKGEFVKKGTAKQSDKKQPANKTQGHYNRVVSGVLQRMSFYDDIVDVSDDPRRKFPKAKRFYVYIYFLKSGEPWYVGKGTGKRAKIHKRQFKEKLIESDKVFAGLTEKQAWNLEKALVVRIGTVYTGDGPLSNITEGGPGIHAVTGKPFSLEHRKRIGDAHRGKPIGPMSPEARKHVGDAQRGIPKPPLSPEHKKHISDAHRGKHHSPETIKRMSDAHRGVPKSPEHKKRIGDAHRGKQLSPEHRKKLSDAKLGVPRKPFSLETIKRMSKPKSPEHRKHISDARKRYWATVHRAKAEGSLTVRLMKLAYS